MKLFKFKPQIILASCTLILLAWLSSGTMAPYAAANPEGETMVHPICGYLYNGDHLHFKAAFNMLDGQPRHTWTFSVAIRRILYPIIAYPLMKLINFEIGGFITNILLMLLALVLFGLYVRKYYNDNVAILAIWLIATYPGIFYWIGLPYCYAVIVPFSIFLSMIIIHIFELRKLKTVFLYSLLMGVLFLGYDLLPIYGSALLLGLLFKKRFLATIISLVGMSLPIAIVYSLISNLAVGISNSNSQVFPIIVKSYLGNFSISTYWSALKNIPGILYENYFYSNFFVFPAAFLIIFLLIFIAKKKLPIFCKMLLLSTGLLFLFNNLAPPYQGWQMRGVWIPRIYQSVFMAFIFAFLHFALIEFKNKLRSIKLIFFPIIISFIIITNTLIILSPVLNIKFFQKPYYRFYKYAQEDGLYISMIKHGRRPLGICKKKVQ